MEMEEPETRTLNWERGLRSDDEDELGVPESKWRVETHSEKAGDGEWFLPTGEKVFVVIGDTKPAAKQRSKGRTIRAATCSVCGKKFENHRSGPKHMIYEHKAVKRLSDLQGVKPAPRVAPVRRDIFASFGSPRPLVDPPVAIAPEGDVPVTVRQEQVPPGPIAAPRGPALRMSGTRYS
jgi:hypothetical protein